MAAGQYQLKPPLPFTPGVEAAATSATLPGVPGRYQTELKFSEGQIDANRKIVAESRFVSPGYFGTLRIPLLSGDLCQTHLDSLDILVNRSFADTYLAGSPVMGRHMEVLNDNFVRPGEIRGIVADARAFRRFNL